MTPFWRGETCARPVQYTRCEITSLSLSVSLSLCLARARSLSLSSCLSLSRALSRRTEWECPLALGPRSTLQPSERSNDRRESERNAERSLITCPYIADRLCWVSNPPLSPSPSLSISLFLHLPLSPSNPRPKGVRKERCALLAGRDLRAPRAERERVCACVCVCV